MKKKLLCSIAGKAQELCEKLLKESPKEPQLFPESGGVSLIYKAGKVIYVGKAKNIRRRICTDHMSGERRDTMSAFRRSVHRKY